MATQQIAGAFAGRAYLPSRTPAGFLYTGWQRTNGFDSDTGDLTVNFARAGHKVIWAVPSDTFDCPALSFEHGVRVSGHTVYMSEHNGTRTAWVCVGSKQKPLEVEASDRRYLAPGDLRRLVASARLAAQLPPADVAVVKSAFQQDSSSSGTVITCELELTNRSPNTDAIGVEADVAFVDQLGRSVATDKTTLTGIPAGATVGATCGAFSNVSLSISSLQVNVNVSRSQPKELVLPPVANVHVQPGQFSFSSPSLVGQLTNPYTKPLPSSARIYALYRDSSGNLIGGDSESAGAAVQPNATVNFGFDFIADASVGALVTIDPCGGFQLDPADCPALSH